MSAPPLDSDIRRVAQAADALDRIRYALADLDKNPNMSKADFIALVRHILDVHAVEALGPLKDNLQDGGRYA